MRLGLFILFLLGKLAVGAKILALFPFPFYSHTHTFIPVFKELAARGHHVTFLSPYPQLPPPQNWENIATDEKSISSAVSDSFREFKNANRYNFFLKACDWCEALNEEAFKNGAVRNLIDQKTLGHDVIITETFVCHEALTALGTKHNIPVVGVYPLVMPAWAAYVTGDDFLPSYIPDPRSPFSDQMGFLERFENTLLAAIQFAYAFCYYLPKQESLMEKYIFHNSKNHPPLVDILKNISIHLVDTHFSLAYPRSYQPRTISVGGISTVSSQNLTKDLEEFLDNSPNGFIYLNFGTRMPVSSLSPSILDAFLTTFNNINFNVLMKWELDLLPNKPQNVRFQNWLPQLSILAHPKCRLFVTHGGLHSISESAYHGVPIVGIPLFSDQIYNVRFSEKDGFGYKLDKEEITAESFQHAIGTVLQEKSYKEHAMRRSKIMRDRPDSALDTAVYWIEYTLRHKDLSHLRPATTSLPFYQLYLLDVFAVIIICLFLVLTILFYSVRLALRSIKNTVRETSKKKSN